MRISDWSSDVCSSDLDEHCRHRGASLVLGRVEDCGIRCIYHGWKFAADGTVLDTPNVADPNFKTRFKARSYPIRPAGGQIGRASCRESVSQYVSLLVVDVSFKKKTSNEQQKQK